MGSPEGSGRPVAASTCVTMHLTQPHGGVKRGTARQGPGECEDREARYVFLSRSFVSTLSPAPRTPNSAHESSAHGIREGGLALAWLEGSRLVFSKRGVSARLGAGSGFVFFFFFLLCLIRSTMILGRNREIGTGGLPARSIRVLRSASEAVDAR